MKYSQLELNIKTLQNNLTKLHKEKIEIEKHIELTSIMLQMKMEKLKNE